MTHPIASKKRAKNYSFALFIVGLVALSFLGQWWPGIMLVIGLPLALRQYLTGKFYDVGVTLFVFLGVFFSVQFDVTWWEVLLPVLFTTGGIYIFFRDYLESKEEPETEREEDLNEEIEETQHPK